MTLLASLDKRVEGKLLEERGRAQHAGRLAEIQRRVDENMRMTRAAVVERRRQDAIDDWFGNGPS
ncbi:hypothetical protein LAZ40_04550 [Cereibacter sphaeroides]|uniref:hypothetical protein n=1 Tax=Cereibacter sphaeroides TaxID=1063 RepID=UPI001F3FD2B9|nr:hypothetical protein [Cereibacter sphaeroides]MCE6958326.1 hypothetical protein [Cereibacter sphaeroides]MCE6971156.1 hypothetical protein [Cereibacter sphaeroides]